jgi:ABC-2 type transport system ATP-binding protein
MSDEIAIKVNSVSKTFKLPHEKQTSIKSAFVSAFRGKRTFEKQKVLNDISFEIKKGEFFGIVGRNGSGKSTLLKLLAGIYSPDKGAIQVTGLLTPFIELGVGFNPELTGRENVYLNGALLGFNRKEMNEMYQEIVDFAEIEKFMDQKLKNYSSGMQVRLAFSIAIRAKSDILLIDEVLAVGDSAFQKKCYEVFTGLKKAGRTIVFVTHDMSAVERFCDKVLVINKGFSQGVMEPRDAGAYYDELNAQKSEKTTAKTKDAPNRWGSGEVLLDDLAFWSKGKKLTSQAAQMGEDLELRLRLTGDNKKKIIIGLAFEDVYGANISGPNSKGIDLDVEKEVNYRVDRLSLSPGEYKVTVVVFDSDLNELDHHDRAFTLRVKAKDHNVFGKVNLFGKWEN